jgi:hypothetical protein
MAISLRNVLVLAGSAALLAACATGPYDYGYGYNGYGAPDPYEGYPGYGYAPGYVGPSVGVGIGFSDYDGGRGQREWHGDRRGDWHGDRGGDWHGDRGGRDGHDRDGHDRDGDHDHDHH